MAEYAPPVAGLLKLGKIDPRVEWLDYKARGIGREHIDDLVRMMLDDALIEDDIDSPEAWGSIHAWRALGQLQATEAIGALIEARNRSHERGGDWFSEEAPELMALIGPAALPALAASLRDSSFDLYPRWNSAECIGAIGKRHTETRAECVALLSGELERLTEAPEEGEIDTLRAGIIATLVDLKAVEAAPLIERVFATCDVDEFIAGGWEDARYRLGLGPPPQRRATPSVGGPRTGSPKDRDRERTRNKRKMAKESKKKNRKKK
jgi:hypothetical protein